MPERRRSWVRATAAVLVAAVLAGCGDTATTPSDDAELTVYVSVPLRGLFAPDGRDVADGASLALGEAGGEAGGVSIRLRTFDDAGAGRETLPTPARAAANARVATQDSTAIAYLGELSSGATRASLPITNEARLLHVSPGAGATDLVAPFAGSDDVPETQPSGERTFGRVIPSDEIQGAAAAAWAERIGAREIATVSDDSLYGESVLAAFEDAVERATLSRRGGDLLFFAGEGEQPASLTQSFRGMVMVTDAQLPPAGVGAQPPGTLATSAALDPDHLPSAGRDFARRFEQEYGRPPGRYGAYGYEAMAVVLHAIEQAEDPTNREEVTDAFFATKDRDSVLGSYSIDELGETTLDRLTGYRLDGARWVPEAELRAP